MSGLMREFRLIPIVLVATVCLFALKVSGLVFDGGYTLADRLRGRDTAALQVTSASVPDYPKITFDNSRVAMADAAPRPNTGSNPKSWAEQMFNYGDVTGSVGEGEKPPAGPPLKTSEKAPDPPKLDVGGNTYQLDQGKINSPGERAVLESLQKRREELDKLNKDIDMRESLLKAAEKRVQSKVDELKAVESRVSIATASRDEAEAQRFKAIVTMYENMKPKDAARIFDVLDMRILIEVATAMNPRKMSEVLAQMSSDGAQRLTVELANRANEAKALASNPQASNQLPKIQGTQAGP